MKSQKGFSTIIIVLLGTIVVFIGYLVYQKQISTTSSPQPATPNKVLSSLQKYLDVSAPIEETLPANGEWWKDNNNQIIPLKGYSFGIGTGKYGGGTYGNITRISEATQEALSPLKDSTEQFFNKANFVRNTKNTLEDTSANYWFDYKFGFENENLKCLVVISIQSDPFGSFFCGEIDEDQLAKSRELSSINTENYPDTIVRVKKINQDSAEGSISTLNGMGGARWIAVKKDGKWLKVFEGQNLPECELMDRYKITKEIYENCYEENDKERFDTF